MSGVYIKKATYFMKKTTNKIILSILFLSLYSCFTWETSDDEVIVSRQMYEAVTMLRTEFENSTDLLPPKPIENSGKIYVKGNYLFINEPNKGFHIYDNFNPSSPVNLAFLKVLGSSDMSIKGDILYINNATDLIAIKPNFSENSIEITKRIVNTFPELVAPNNFGFYNTQENEVIIDWNLIE